MAMRTLTLWSLHLVVSGCFGQDALQGEVTFITANNVYVNFGTTAAIAIGDTLHVVKGTEVSPCLVVTTKSTTSCLCTVVAGCKVQKNDKVVLRTPHPVVPPSGRSTGKAEKGPAAEKVRDNGERYRGRLSATSYSTIPSARENDHRVMYRLSANADRIGGSKFSAETYLNYRQLFPAGESKYPQRTEFFNVYSLAVNYAPDSTFSITLGRRVNNSASSLGAIDGLQVEKHFGGFFTGVIAGSRPDIIDYGLNVGLLEYGGYLGYARSAEKLDTRTTLGLLQQTNAGPVDRRYAYFQHSSTFWNDLNIFGSFELDLYGLVDGAPTTKARLTNFYLSSRYRFGKRVDLFASYDARRRIVYYETYRSDIEILLDDDDAMQGARLRLNVRPIKDISLSASYSKRFESDGGNRSDNINGYITFSKVPAIGGRWSVQVNRNTSSYVRSDVLSVRHSRMLVKKRMNASVYFRMANYRYSTLLDVEGVPVERHQKFYGVDLSYNILPKLVFSVLGELSTMGDEQNYRVNVSITKRFDSKR